MLMTFRQKLAVHEAGHFVVGWRTGQVADYITLDSDRPGLLAYCRFDRLDTGTAAGIARNLVVVAAGVVAGRMVGLWADHHEASDEDAIRSGVSAWHRLAGPGESLPDPFLSARRLLAEPPTWAAVQSVARALEVFGSLTGRQAASVAQAGWRAGA